MLHNILKVSRYRPNNNRLLYVFSLPPYDIHRFAIKPGQNALSKRGKTKRNQLIKRIDLLKGYRGQDNEVYACFADTLQCNNTFCEAYLAKLSKAYSTQDPSVVGSVATRDGIELNQFCIDYFGEDFPRTEQIVQEGENLLLPYRPGALSSLRKAAVEQYKPYYQAIEKLMPIYPWQVFIEHQKYNPHLETIHNRYQKNPRFREAVIGVIRNRIEKLTDNAIDSKNLSREQYKNVQTVLTLPLLNYSFEELAVWELWNDAYNFTHVAYPGKLNPAFEFIKQGTSIEFIDTDELEVQSSKPSKLVNHPASFFAAPSIVKTDQQSSNATKISIQPSNSILMNA